ncbi:unnamed protein product [Ilex paraguariensis]|uniref:Pentatricopeptide repeat-containing protein n=1 Tax=Ilex paraguariensis TaxID=185542 RepID=A0ABC8RM25_9AQUA
MRTSDRPLLSIFRQICTLPSANLNKTIMGYIRNGNLNNARKLFDQNPTSRNVVSWNSLISGYLRNSQLVHAQVLFDQMPYRDVVSWNTMLSGLHDNKSPEKVFQCFLEMSRAGQRPNEFTFSMVITAFLNPSFNMLIPQLHGHIIRLALNLCVFVGSALIRGYSDLWDRKSFCQVFEDIIIKDVTSWNALILSFMDLGLATEAQRAFDMIPEKNIVSWTSLFNGYIKNKNLNEAETVFYKMNTRNVISWTAMIKGYVQYGKFVDALELFVLMLSSGTRPNHFTLASVCDACAGCSSLFVGHQVHSCLVKSGIPLDVILSTSLVEMYAKCGDIEAASSIFQSMQQKNLVSWNSIIGGYARHGLATKALNGFETMIKGGVRPDQITFINLLSACGHGGLVEEGERHFNSMEMTYCVQPEMEHYACMVDLYGRAGLLEKAEKLIKGMPLEPDVFVWGALLGACGLHSCLELGRFAAEGIYKLQKNHPAVYLMLSKIHGEKGTWSSVVELTKMMKERRAKKQKARSWCDL